VEKAIVPGKTKLVWIETPTNPTLRLTDVVGLSELIKKIDRNIVYVVDSTFTSSYLQQPLALGADVVMHSLTKYMNGHSDVVMGAVMTNSEPVFEKLKFYQNSIGAIPSPFDCFLVNRGLKTLALRMRAHSSNALKIAQMLEQHDKVRDVIYPGLRSHPQHELALKQMPKGFSGMVSFYIRSSDPDAASKFVSLVKVFTLAESLGGIESLCEIPALMTHASHPDEVRHKLGIDNGLVRLSVGIESADDLIRDIEQALDQIPL
jgi:cystathionine gamma-lyase